MTVPDAAIQLEQLRADPHVSQIRLDKHCGCYSWRYDDEYEWGYGSFGCDEHPKGTL